MTATWSEAASERAGTYRRLAFEGVIGRITTAPDDTRAAVLSAGAFRIGQLKAAGPNVAGWLGSHGKQQLVLAAVAAGVPKDLAEQTVDLGLQAGEQAGPPEDLPDFEAPEEAEESAGAEGMQLAGKPVINISDENLGRATADIWSAMLASEYGPQLYRYGTEIALLRDGLTTVDEVHWRGLVNRAAHFVKTRTGKDETVTYREVIPPLAMIADSLKFLPDTLPIIDRISPLPIFNARGQLLTAGYHPESRTLITSDIVPAELDVGAAIEIILGNLLVDFPFASQADRANTVAYLLLPFIREMCDAMPLFLIDAAQRGTGKTLLNTLVHKIWTGKATPLSDLPLNAEEQRKAITTHLIGAPVSVVFDDISLLAGHALQRAVTGDVWNDRQLGTNKPIEVPIRTIWAATGNNVTLGGDMVRRTVLIRLESDHEHPSQRTGFKRSESDIKAWADENRVLLVSACTSLVAHGLAHGRPEGVALGGFDQFARVITRILNGIGVPGFCENLASVLAREDSRQTGWRAVIRAWWEQHGDRKVKAAEILKLIDADDDNEVIVDGDNVKARLTATGKLVKSKVGSIFALDEARVRLEVAKDSKGYPCYRLQEVASAGGAPHQDAIPGPPGPPGHSQPVRDRAQVQARTDASELPMSGTSGMSGDGIETPKTPTAAELMLQRMQARKAAK